MPPGFGPRRGTYRDIADELKSGLPPLSAAEVQAFESFDLIYRSLCAMLYNYVPMSGHPGGSISSGRIAQALLFDTLEYDVANPDREDADLVSYAAGHKAMGMYALWALRNEVIRLGAPELLPSDERYQLRIEDLLGFRRNPVARTPLFDRLRCKALDGHPTPATPFLRIATGASGVGVASSLGLAFAARDFYGERAPRVHLLEGEGGMTPGRVAEALAAAGTASLSNAFLHVDWNQASIDSNRVCRDGATPGDYVQWDPAELCWLHDWSVVYVSDGFDFQQVVAAQRAAVAGPSSQPTAVVYRTVKGWQYGIEGRASHGAGHKLCSNAFHAALAPLTGVAGISLPGCEANAQRCGGGAQPEVMEDCFYEALSVIRGHMEKQPVMVTALAGRLRQSRERLGRAGRRARAGAPDIDVAWETAARETTSIPASLVLAPGATTTLRGELGRVLQHYNAATGGALMVASADLLGSTSVNTIAKGFPEGFWHAKTNPGARLLSLGGICEDAMAGILAGISAYGRHIGVGSSYGAFLAPLGHIAARLHAIGNQARQAIHQEPYRPFVLVCAHAGLKTGEDGPTHADPQALQILQENFPPGTAVTLTPWDPQEMWTLVSVAFAARPAVIAVYVTRPNEKVLDRAALGLAPVSDAATGLYRLRHARRSPASGTLVLQESAVTYSFITEALPILEREGVDLDVYYVASVELFDRLPEAEREGIFPEAAAQTAFGITGFTMPTLYRWVRSERARKAALHPFRHGHFLGSGQGEKVLAEAGLDGASQAQAILAYLRG